MENENGAKTQEQQLEQFIHENLPRWRDELARLCAVASVSAHADAAVMQQMAKLIEESLAARQLQTQVWPTENDGNSVVFGEWRGQPEQQTLLIYDHYDVQPVEPLDKWQTDPFTLTERDGYWWGRGVADNKGNLVARLAALETYRAIYGELPVNIKFLVEGEEEIGSPNLGALIQTKKDELTANGCIWEFGHYTSDGTPILHLGLKGILSLELISKALSHDAHSSLAGILPSAVWRLVWALSAINDVKDGILVSGFYDDVSVPTREDSQFLLHIKDQFGQRLAERLKVFGIDEYVAGLQGLPLLITEFFTPTVNVSGIESGYMGAGYKTVLPAEAKARIDFRLVPDQDPETILENLKEYLADYGYIDIQLKQSGAAMKPARTSPSDPFVQLATQAARTASGLEPLIIPLSPASGPMFVLKEHLDNIPIVSAGSSNDGSNQHAANENIRSEDFVRHIKFMVQLMRDMAISQSDSIGAELDLPEIEPFDMGEVGPEDLVDVDSSGGPESLEALIDLEQSESQT